jgi:tetratricopeptide (TPR) repeat protein
VAREMGDYESSLRWHNKALEIKIRKLQPDNPSIAENLNSIGHVFEKKKDYERALESYEKALMIYRQRFDENHPKVAASAGQLGGERGQLPPLKIFHGAIRIYCPPHSEYFLCAIIVPSMEIKSY